MRAYVKRVFDAFVVYDENDSRDFRLYGLHDGLAVFDSGEEAQEYAMMLNTLADGEGNKALRMNYLSRIMG